MSLIGLFFAIVSLLSTAAFSQIPSYAWYDDAGENDGLSEDKPFLIANANELAGFASIVNGVDGRTKDNFSGKFIKLTSDIMLQADTSDWKNWETVPPDEEWIGINGLKGTFDGAGYVIGGVYVFNTSASKGFFTTIGYGGTVKNLGIVASYVIGGYYVGLLAGASSGTIENCYATGNVKGITQVGGLIGVSGGTIENSYATGNVEATANVGGLVGFNENYGVIRNSHATGNVNANNSPSGGLVGTNGSIGYRGTIENSYATGNVKGSWDVGGLVGYNQPGSKIEESYATGSVEGNREVGGLIGKNNGAAKNSYATGSVEGQRYRGGLVGTNVEGVIENCYAAGSVTEKAVEGEESLNDYFGGLAGNSLGEIVDSYFDSNVYTDEHNGFGYPKSETEMKDKETYENWDFTSIWDMDKEANGGYPFLRHLSVTFIAVENISGVVASAASGGSKSLSAIVKPANATNKAIIWSVVSGNATIDGSNITFNAEGQVKIRATIVNGVAHNVDYTQDFDIEVSAETPVSLPRIATRNINAKAVGKTIILENLPQNAKVQIYNLRGGRIYSVNLENPKILQIGVKTKGIFVVKINNTVLRIPVM